MLFGVIVRCIMVALTVFWVVSFLVVRFVVFIEAWQRAHAVLMDERWLLKQCEDADFFANMRLHSDLCIQVQRNAEHSPVLVAMNAVANTAHLCGRHSCLDTLVHLSDGVGWPALLWTAAALVVGNMLLCIGQKLIRMQKDGCAGVYKKYNGCPI
jgi:hypothetical protein